MGDVIQATSAKVEFLQILLFFQIVVTCVELHYGNNLCIKIFKTANGTVDNTPKDERMTFRGIACQNHHKQVIFQIIYCV